MNNSARKNEDNSVFIVLGIMFLILGSCFAIVNKSVGIVTYIFLGMGVFFTLFVSMKFFFAKKKA